MNLAAPLFAPQGNNQVGPVLRLAQAPAGVGGGNVAGGAGGAINNLSTLGDSTKKLLRQGDSYAQATQSLDSVVSPDQLLALNTTLQNLNVNKNMFQLITRATQDFLKTTLGSAQGWFA